MISNFDMWCDHCKSATHYTHECNHTPAASVGVNPIIESDNSSVSAAYTVLNFEQDYEAAIPACCSLRTLEEHNEILLCASLSSAVRDGRDMDCGDCEMIILECPGCSRCKGQKER